MIAFRPGRVLSIGEAMVEMAPAGKGVYAQGFAGDCYNTIWHMGRLLRGRASCGFVTRIGTDKLSDRFAAGMARDGLDLAAVQRDPERQMGLYLIELDGVERSFHYWRQLSAARRLADDPIILRSAIAGASLIHLSGISLAILSPDARVNLFDALAEARSAGTIISFDPNIRPRLWSSPDEARAAVTEMIGHTDIALPSFDDEATLWGDASPEATIARFAGAGVRDVVVKHGAKPLHTLADGQSITVATPPVSDIRDTTGAGDGFNAGYLSGRITGLDLQRSVMLGQRISAEVLRTPGALASRETMEALAPA